MVIVGCGNDNLVGFVINFLDCNLTSQFTIHVNSFANLFFGRYAIWEWVSIFTCCKDTIQICKIMINQLYVSFDCWFVVINFNFVQVQFYVAKLAFFSDQWSSSLPFCKKRIICFLHMYRCVCLIICILIQLTVSNLLYDTGQFPICCMIWVFVIN